jgi:hypothetical protein
MGVSQRPVALIAKVGFVVPAPDFSRGSGLLSSRDVFSRNYRAFSPSVNALGCPASTAATMAKALTLYTGAFPRV